MVLLQDLLIEPLYLVVFGVNIPMSEDELFQMSNWTGMRMVRKWGGMAQSVEHIVHIDGAQAPVALVLIDQAKRDRWFESNCHHHKTLAV